MLSDIPSSSSQSKVCESYKFFFKYSYNTCQFKQTPCGEQGRNVQVLLLIRIFSLSLFHITRSVSRSFLNLFFKPNTPFCFSSPIPSPSLPLSFPFLFFLSLSLYPVHSCPSSTISTHLANDLPLLTSPAGHQEDHVTRQGKHSNSWLPATPRKAVNYTPHATQRKRKRNTVTLTVHVCLTYTYMQHTVIHACKHVTYTYQHARYINTHNRGDANSYQHEKHTYIQTDIPAAH